MESVAEFFEKLGQDLTKTLFLEDRWKLYVEGIGNTLAMALLATLMGIIIGLVIAVVKVSHAGTGKLKFLNFLCNLYTTVIRGTPVLVQLLIIYFIVFASVRGMAVLIASFAFGLNSGAYVSEIFRGGINSVDKGQVEAGRSLGLNSGQTMRLIVLPQAVKNILPSLFNEFISLFKETSVAGYISIREITRVGDLIRSKTYAFFPLIITACIYLVFVIGLTKLQGILERRLSAGDRR